MRRTCFRLIPEDCNSWDCQVRRDFLVTALLSSDIRVKTAQKIPRGLSELRGNNALLDLKENNRVALR